MTVKELIEKLTPYLDKTVGLSISDDRGAVGKDGETITYVAGGKSVDIEPTEDTLWIVGTIEESGEENQ